MRARPFAHLSRHHLRISLLMTAVACSLGAALAPAVATAQSSPLVRYYTQPTDMFGNPISEVLVGEKFKLEVFVQDMRDPEVPPFSGVFAGTTRVTFDDSLTPLALPPDVQIDSFFPLATLLEIAPDAVIVSGTSTSLQSPGNDPQKLFSIVLEATEPGIQIFTPMFYETLDHFTLLYGLENEIQDILFQGSTLSVVPEPSTWAGMLIGAAFLCIYGRRARPRTDSQRSIAKRPAVRVGAAKIACIVALAVGLLSASPAGAAHLVRYSTRTTDLVGNLINSVQVGEQFKLEVIAQDITDPAPPRSGLFSPAVKVQFDDSLTPALTPSQHLMDDFFDNLYWSIRVTPDAILADGVSTSIVAPGNTPQRFFNIVLEAANPGLQVFVPMFYETPDVATITYGYNGEVVHEDQILFQGSTLEVLVPEPGTWIGMLVGAASLYGYKPRAGRRQPRRIISKFEHPKAQAQSAHT